MESTWNSETRTKFSLIFSRSLEVFRFLPPWSLLLCVLTSDKETISKTRANYKITDNAPWANFRKTGSQREFKSIGWLLVRIISHGEHFLTCFLFYFTASIRYLEIRWAVDWMWLWAGMSWLEMNLCWFGKNSSLNMIIWMILLTMYRIFILKAKI